MKIIKKDYLDNMLCELVPINIDIVLSKIDSKNLDDLDYDMIKDHLEFYKQLLLDAENREVQK